MSLLLLAALFVAGAAQGCGGGNTGTGGAGGEGGSGPSSSSATTTTSSSSSSSSSASSSSSSTSSSSSGSTAGDHGPPATETVSGGQSAKSQSYRMVFTVGQPTQNQSKMTSSSYRMQGGLIGANGSLQ
jgi:hypothetical protein